MPNEKLVRAWMNAPEHRVSPDATVEEAFALMRRENVRHLLVMNGEQLVGVVTDRDLRRPDWEDGRPLSVEELYQVGQDMRVCDVMTEDVISANADDSTAYAAEVMVNNRINCLPVMNDDAVVGILTSSDLLAALVYAVDPDELDLA